MHYICVTRSFHILPPYRVSTSMSKMREALISDSQSNKNINKKLLLAGFLLVAAVVGIFVASSNKYYNTINAEAEASSSLSPSSHAIIQSACSTTLYPELCFSSITTSQQNLVISSHRDVIQLALNVTSRIAKRNYFTIQRLLTTGDVKLKIALHDCLQTTDATLFHLEKVKQDLKHYPSNSKSLYRHAHDLKTWLSSAITNQVTCLDSFSGISEPRLRKSYSYVEGEQLHVQHLCSNALAMIKSLTDTDIANYEKNNINMVVDEEEDGIKWPEWISGDDRRLLTAYTLTANVVVAADGSGDYTTVSAAVAAAPKGITSSSNRYIIKIKAGVYRENVIVPKEKPYLMFWGEGSDKTMITASKNNVDDGSTYNSATVAVDGEGFLAQGITIQNAAGAIKMQAVALRVGADYSAFYKCSFTGHQDTLYVHSNRQFFVNCFIAGTVDFIFGNSAVVFQDCDIKPTVPLSGQQNMMTAQGRTEANQNTGIVIQKCRIDATKELKAQLDSFTSYLGRPWQEYSRTVVMQSTISNVIDPAGWHPWNESDFALNTLYYGEYQNSGAGADTSNRVTWKGFKVITSASEAETFTAGSFIDGGSWLDSTGFPYSLGL